jgi:hypothetical protein
VAVEAGDLEQQLDLEAHQQREVGRRRQEAPEPGDPALGRRRLLPAVDRLGRLGPAFVQGEPDQRRPRREVRPDQQRPRHPLDGGGDGGMDLLGDDPVDPRLGGASEAVQRAGGLGEVSAPGEEVGGENIQICLAIATKEVREIGRLNFIDLRTNALIERTIKQTRLILPQYLKNIYRLIVVSN